MEDRIPKSSETKHLLLPFPKVFRVPVSSTPQEIPIYPAIVPESCEWYFLNDF